MIQNPSNNKTTMEWLNLTDELTSLNQYRDEIHYFETIRYLFYTFAHDDTDYFMIISQENHKMK